MKDSRESDRVKYSARSVVVVCDTQEQIYVEVSDVSPLGMGIVMPPEAPNIVGKDIIIVAEALVMYADVVRQEKNSDGTYSLGIQAKRFSDDTLHYLFNSI